MANLLFGRLFWIWIVGFLIAASYLSAQTVFNLRRLWAEPNLPIAKNTKGGLLRATTTRRKHLNTILRLQNIFDPNGGMLVPKKKKEKKEPTPRPEPRVVLAKTGGCPPRDPTKELKETRFGRVRLKGTSYIEEAPEMSVAAVYVKVKIKVPVIQPRRVRRRSTRKRRRRRRARRSRRRREVTRRRRRSTGRKMRTKTVWRVEMFRAGDLMMRARICAVERRRVILYRSGKFETLSLDSKKKGKKNWFYGAIGGQKEETKGPGQVKVAATDKFVISRKTVNNWLANPMQYAMSARIMPHYQNNQPAGFRLVWVRKGSLYSQIGLKSGDVVQQINGKNLSVGSALGLYSKLPYAKQLRVNIIRKGVRRSIQYTVK